MGSAPFAEISFFSQNHCYNIINMIFWGQAHGNTGTQEIQTALHSKLHPGKVRCRPLGFSERNIGLPLSRIRNHARQKDNQAGHYHAPG